MNFRQLDLNLLRVLCAVHRTGSVTAASRELALSQPATSNALARLRRFFNDALFVRSPRGLHPTTLVLRIAPMVAEHLKAMEMGMGAGAGFDPAHHRMDWRITMSDLGEMMFLPPLARMLRQQAPHCTLTNEAVAAHEVSASLEERRVDLAIGILLEAHRGVVAETLFREPFVAITGGPEDAPPAARATGVDGTLTRAQLTASWLAIATPLATAHGAVQVMLNRLKLNDRRVVRVRHYAALPELVLSTDLVAIVPTMFAQSARRRHPVRVWALPRPAPTYEVRLLWHESTRHDSAHGWLRDGVRYLFRRSTADE